MMSYFWPVSKSFSFSDTELSLHDSKRFACNDRFYLDLVEDSLGLFVFFLVYFQPDTVPVRSCPALSGTTSEVCKKESSWSAELTHLVF